MVTIPCIVVVVVFASSIINIMLDKAFLPAAPVLITLTFYLYFTSLMMPYSALLRGADRPNITAKIGLAMCLVNIILNYLFIPESGLLSLFGINGPTGAALATLLSTTVGFFGLRFYARKLTGIKIVQSHIPRQIVAGFIMGAILYYIGTFILTVHWYHLLLYAGIGLGIYLGVLFVLKEFKKQDLMFFLDILRPKEMLGYIKSELKEK